MKPDWEVPGPPGTRFSSIHHVVTTGSTNADLVAEAENGGRAGLVLVADHQDAGRGRQNRRWHDEPGNSMLLSVLTRPPTAWASLLPLLVGVAVADAVDEITSRSADASLAALKWPNDVLVPEQGERKLAGILAEATSCGPNLAVVTGIGVNLRFGGPIPDEVATRAIALEEVAGHAVDRGDVVQAVLRALDARLRSAEVDGPEAILTPYRSRCGTIGRRVRFDTSTAVVEGPAVGVADDGGLIVETESGPVSLTAGDAHHL